MSEKEINKENNEKRLFQFRDYYSWYVTITAEECPYREGNVCRLGSGDCNEDNCKEWSS
jgi:hypothetical protein